MRYLLIFLPVCLLLAGLQPATAQSGTNPQPVVTLNHIALYVHDLKESAPFYEEVLQLKKIQEPFHDGLHEWFSIGENSQLHLIQGAEQGVERDKNTHLCFSVPSVDDFIVNLDKHKVEYENWAGDAKAPTVRVDGVKQVYFQDPDGYWVEINDDFPGRK